jgi:hypothetical protein
MSDSFGLWDVFVSMFWFMLLVAWISLFFRIIGDIFRDEELNGGAKALWTLALIFLPWLGALMYLIVRGGSMNQRAIEAARENENRFRAYVQDAAGSTGTSSADELRKLADLRDSGAITAGDYDKAKAKVLA